MKKNKVIFLATEIILCVLALFFTFKMFDQNETEKKVAVIVQNSGDKNWNSFIKGLKELRRLRLEEEALLKKQRESSTASGENSN